MATFGDTRARVDGRVQDLVNKLGRQRGISLPAIKVRYGSEAETELTQLLNGFEQDLHILRRGIVDNLNELERSVFEMFAEAAARQNSR